MKEIEIPLPRHADCERIGRVIDEAVVSCGLQVTLKGSLGKFSGSTHWHVKNGNDKGTLEITLWPKELRAWFSIQDGRKAEWIDEKVSLFQNLLQQAFRKKHSKAVASKPSCQSGRALHLTD